MKYIKLLLRMALGGAVLIVTAVVIFSTTQAVLAQPLEHATVYLNLFSETHLCTE